LFLAPSVCVSARLEFCVVCSLLRGLLENMQSKRMKNEFNILLRTGLEGMTVESGVFRCRKSDSKGGWTWLQLIRSCTLCLPSVQFQDRGREITCRSPMSEVRKSEIGSFRRSPKTRERGNLNKAWLILNWKIQVEVAKYLY
jgi:hypothetical protein